jgi:hypothetical protein
VVREVGRKNAEVKLDIAWVRDGKSLSRTLGVSSKKFGGKEPILGLGAPTG